ncbi:SirB2 family protein [Panacagrimonas sp.]|uniref:SirB2 family protein n=1 Tax=Panacagrimonas sp. TaxID=2480088 RepID=UPI003B517EB9
MIEYYSQIKFVHIVAVLISGSLFFLRGLMVLSSKQGLALAMPVRYRSYTIDTVLLTAALMLVSLLPAAVFSNGWLTVKLILLVAYIVLGSFALKRAARPNAQRLSFVFALLTYGVMVSVARAHHPLGALHSWFG